uniref:Calcium homeostasis modulator protein n=1 Tax=Zosterops lateralis melanops TaxID=1220523 RepID=A0A8D2Q0V6_ZOSLA
MNGLRKILEFCVRHQTILGCSTVSLLTVASEQIFSSVVFKCPCNSWNMLYGSSFLLAPAIVLFVLGFMVKPKMWRLLTGKCCAEKHCECSPQETCTGFSEELLSLTAKALVAPFTWIAVALLGANYYECAASGSSLIKNCVCGENNGNCSKLLLKVPCGEISEEIADSEWLSFQAQSQLIGWILIATIMAVVLILTCICICCCSDVRYLQLKFGKIYSKKERELFEIKAKEHATKLAERNTNCFFEVTDPVPFPTPSNEDWKKISTMYTINSNEPYYSMIHKYVSTNRGNSAKSQKGGQDPTVLARADEAQTNV